MNNSILATFVREGESLSNSSSERSFRALFGCSPMVCVIIWNLLTNQHPIDSKPLYMLYGLLFLKVYGTENVNRTITGTYESKFRYWAWLYVKLISKLNVVSNIY